MARVCCFLFLICSTVYAQKVDKDVVYPYSDAVDFSVLALNKQKMVSRGNYTVIAPKGKKFVTLVMDFENKTSKEHIIDFEQFFIKGQTSELHKVDFVVMALKLTLSTSRFQQKLKSNAKRRIVVQFVPPVGKDETITALVVNGVEHTLKYKK